MFLLNIDKSELHHANDWSFIILSSTRLPVISISMWIEQDNCVIVFTFFLDRRILRRLWIQFSGFVIEKRTTRKMVNWVCSLVGRIFYFSFFSGSYLLVNPNRTRMIEMGWHVNTNKGPRRLTTAHGDVSRRNFKNIQILKQYFKTTSCF